MKQIWYAVCLLTGSLLYSIHAPAQTTTSGALLAQMSQASQTLDYEYAYVLVSKLGVDSLCYRHVVIDKQRLAQLLQMDGPRREIVQRNGEISYFEPRLEPFTLLGDHIVDSLPSIVYANFERLAHFYDFISVGRARIADRLCEVVRVVARDGTRFSYIVWIDTTTKLPLRVDLLDRDGEALEQFRVIAFNADKQVENTMAGLEKVTLPPQLALPVSTTADFDWSVNWLPAGVTEASRSRRTLPGINEPIEARLYTDGLFSFSVNVGQATTGNGERLIRTGRRTIHTEHRGSREITVVGELPPVTAKRIADAVVFKAQS
ncbi:Sigma factor RpoE negative regulatory protein RseB [Candidatus Sodalis pierantonius str. SOPE]|uniref:Sigma factor RpoE negative regulatory protein RseB n=1 Tax=Candidatus Sodalis pierantonii str. SOPE TaxID=2342 RepID=W0HQ41_9GAMM|nr:sigma-E factor regulatory protein RseB [Candidatus Sodalis pierantonius]AHF74622.1 Sigma factor RpoE negative regulatory protein RseB [Candidatus Sodalis pierantonius str. SOPE]